MKFYLIESALFEKTQYRERNESEAANGKHMLNMCSYSVSLLRKCDVVCTKFFYCYHPSNLWCVLQEILEKIYLIFFLLGFLTNISENFEKFWPLSSFSSFLAKNLCFLQNYLAQLINLLGNLSNLSFLAGAEHLRWLRLRVYPVVCLLDFKCLINVF